MRTYRCWYSRVFRPDELDGTDFADGHSAQLDEGAHRKVFHFAGDIGLKDVALAEIGLQTHGKERRDEQAAPVSTKSPILK